MVAMLSVFPLFSSPTFSYLDITLFSLVLADQLHAMVENEGKGQADARIHAIQHCWFYLGLIIKSMALHIKALNLKRCVETGSSAALENIFLQ